MLALRVEIEPEELQRAFRLAERYFEQTKGLGGAGALVLQSEHELVAFLVEEIDDDDGAVAIEEIVEVEIEEGSILQR